MRHEDQQVVTVPRWAMRECGGDARDAMVLSQIGWWLQPAQRDGSPRTRRLHERDGQTWMYLTDAELAEQVGMSPDQVRRARRALSQRGLIETRAAKVDGSKVTLIRSTIGPGEVAESETAESPNSPAAESPNSGNGGIAELRTRATPPGRSSTPEIKDPSRESALLAEGFDKFWEVYPRKTAKGDARKAWPAAVKAAGSMAAIVEGATRYARSRMGQDPKFTKMPAGWLRAEQWSDELGPVSSGLTPARSGGSSLDDWSAFQNKGTR